MPFDAGHTELNNPPFSYESQGQIPAEGGGTLRKETFKGYKLFRARSPVARSLTILVPINVSGLSEARFQKGRVREHDAPARIR